MQKTVKDWIIKLFYDVSIQSSNSKRLNWSKLKDVGLERHYKTKIAENNRIDIEGEYFTHNNVELPFYVDSTVKAMEWYVENIILEKCKLNS